MRTGGTSTNFHSNYLEKALFVYYYVNLSSAYLVGLPCPVSYVFSSSTGNANAEAMASAITALDGNQYVVIFTYDEPKTHATNTNFVNAMKACGASSSFPSMINYRGAYILIGKYGLGAGNGVEYYKGDDFGSSGDPDAKLNVLLPFL